MRIGLDFDKVIVDIGKEYDSSDNGAQLVSEGAIELLQSNDVATIITKRKDLITVIDWLVENALKWDGELQSSISWGESKGLCCLPRDADVFLDDGQYHVDDIQEQGIEAFLFTKEENGCPKKFLQEKGYLGGGK